MKKSRFSIFILIGVVAICVWLFFGRDYVERKKYYNFDTQSWSHASVDQRYYMARYLIDKDLLLGKTKEEVIVMLGDPDMDAAGMLLYDLGDERGSYISMDHDWLDITFSSASNRGVALRYVIRPD